MVRYGHALHAVLDGLVHELWHGSLSVKYAILSMYVQMYEVFHIYVRCRLAHRAIFYLSVPKVCDCSCKCSAFFQISLPLGVVFYQ